MYPHNDLPLADQQELTEYRSEDDSGQAPLWFLASAIVLAFSLAILVGWGMFELAARLLP